MKPNFTGLGIKYNSYLPRGAKASPENNYGLNHSPKVKGGWLIGNEGDYHVTSREPLVCTSAVTSILRNAGIPMPNKGSLEDIRVSALKDFFENNHSFQKLPGASSTRGGDIVLVPDRNRSNGYHIGIKTGPGRIVHCFMSNPSSASGIHETGFEHFFYPGTDPHAATSYRFMG